MIQFLRRARKKLLAEQKISHYLIYAIGEILLVVLGILIALWINDWNEGQKNARIEAAFLENFKNDLLIDIQTLEEKITYNSERIQHTDSIISTLSSKNQLLASELVKFYNWNLSLAFESYFIPEKSTLSQFEANDKNGELITSKALRHKLFKYYSTNERIEANVERSMQLYQHNFLTKDIIQHILGGDVINIMVGSDFGRPKFNLNELKQNSEYVFALLTKRAVTVNQNQVYRKIKQSAEELIRLIDGGKNK